MFVYQGINPTALSIGPLSIRWYGLMYLLGFLVGWFLGRYRAKLSRTRYAETDPRHWQGQEVDDLITYCVVGLVLGGRIGYTLFYNYSYFIQDPVEIFKIWNGGMSFHGGVLGLALALWIFAKRCNKSFFLVGDFLVPLAPLGLFFGRMGNFINSELWGRPTSLPWGVVFPDKASGDMPRHPSQLYEGFLEGFVLFAILWIYTSKPRPQGAAIGIFLAGYGVFRFAVEFARQPDAHIGYVAFGWLTMGQLLCLPMILLGALCFYVAHKRR